MIFDRAFFQVWDPPQWNLNYSNRAVYAPLYYGWSVKRKKNEPIISDRAEKTLKLCYYETILEWNKEHVNCEQKTHNRIHINIASTTKHTIPSTWPSYPKQNTKLSTPHWHPHDYRIHNKTYNTIQVTIESTTKHSVPSTSQYHPHDYRFHNKTHNTIHITMPFTKLSHPHNYRIHNTQLLLST